MRYPTNWLEDTTSPSMIADANTMPMFLKTPRIFIVKAPDGHNINRKAVQYQL
jgi:hypothetical protein